MEYQHTQRGYFGIVTVGILIPVVGAVAVSDDDPWATVLVVLLIGLILAVVLWFSRLTVTVDGDSVTSAFGLGKPAKTIDLSGVAHVRRVRNPWYYGWGIRKVPGGWMYNVWGFEAVELDLASGRVFRIGTDEPDELAEVLSLLATG